MSPKLRVFSAGIAAEINTFSPLRCDIPAFKETFYCEAGKHPNEPTLFTAPLWIARLRAKAENLELFEGLCASTQPAGMIGRVPYETLRDEMLNDLKAVLPIDIVLLGLHGAMVAEGYPDCEGDMIHRARSIVGTKAIIAVALDPHCHLTKQMTDHADLLIAFKEYPHTDIAERAQELVELALQAARGKIKPVNSVFDCRMIDLYHTPKQPMRAFVDKLQALEGKDGVLSISVAHGFPWADVPDMGTKILVITDNKKSDGDELAAKLGRELFALRGKTGSTQVPVVEIIEKLKAVTDGPVVVSDGSDNPGGGSPSDATQFLRTLIDAGETNIACALIWDPIAVQLASAAGEGATLDLRIGGKACSFSGQPLDLQVTVKKIIPKAVQQFAGGSWPLGDMVCVSTLQGTDLILNTNRSQCFSVNVFEQAGVDLSKKKIIVVKSSQHFYASFAPIAKQVLYAATQGVCSPDLSQFSYQNISRPMWPFDPLVTI